MEDFRRLLELTGSRTPDVNIDFSSISIDDFVPLRDSLLQFCELDITGLTFSIDLQHTVKEADSKRRGSAEQIRLESSIFVQLRYLPSEFSALVSLYLT
jgi:hypothetical protein